MNHDATRKIKIAISFFSLLAFLVLTVTSTSAVAQVVENNLADGPLQAIGTAMRAFQTSTTALLTSTFWILATIEFAISMILVSLNDEGINGVFRELVIRCLFVGFFYTLLVNGIAWTDQIIDTLVQLGNSASTASFAALRPDSFLDLGLDLMKRAGSTVTLGNLGAGMANLLAAAIAFLALVWIAGNFALALAEFYIIGYGGIWLLALGGSRFTSGYAVAYLKYTMSVGMKLFVMIVIAGIGYDVLSSYFTAATLDSGTQLWSLAGFTALLALVAARAPDRAGDLLSGVDTSRSISPAQAYKAGTSAIGGLAAAGAGSLGAGMAVSAAASLGSAQRGNTALNAVSNLAKAAGSEAKSSVTGTRKPGGVFPGGNSGTVGGRMAANMNAQKAKLNRGTDK